MERIEGGEPKNRKVVESRFNVYPDFDIDNLPCLCDSPNVIIMKRGRGTHAIFWADCESCKRQWQPALNLDVAISYYVFAMASKKDPFEFKVRKKRRPKVKLPKNPKPEKKKREYKTKEQAEEVLRRMTVEENRLKRKLKELKEKKK